MLSVVEAIANCLGASRVGDTKTPNEKTPLLFRDLRTTEDIAEEAVQAILKADKDEESTEIANILNAIVGTNGWTEDLAVWILAKLELTLKSETKEPLLSQEEACDVAMSVEGLASGHTAFYTTIALGFLAIKAPLVVKALGFGALGPIAGSWAASWQSRYADFVPEKSLYSFFQRLGISWP